MSMKTFHLEILSAAGIVFSGEAISLTVPLSDGLYGILPGHSPVTAALCGGRVRYVTSEGHFNLIIDSGALTFDGGKAVIVL